MNKLDLTPLIKMLKRAERDDVLTIFEAPVSVKGTISIMLDTNNYEKLQMQMNNNITDIKPVKDESDK